MRSDIAAEKKMKNIGPGVCEVCEEPKKDVVKVKVGFLKSLRICDSCGRQLFRRFVAGRGGRYEG